jgi:hypothetical protein
VLKILWGVVRSMIGRRFQLAAVVLSVVVAVESLLGVVAHRHGQATTACCPPTEPAGLCTSGEPHPEDADHDRPAPSPSHHDPSDCLACQYLAKQALPVVVLDTSCVAQLSNVVILQDAVGDGSSEIALPLSRGPPQLS